MASSVRAPQTCRPRPGAQRSRFRLAREGHVLFGPGQRGIEVDRLFEGHVGRRAEGAAFPVQPADHPGDMPGRRQDPQRRGQPAERIGHQQPRVVDGRGPPQLGVRHRGKHRSRPGEGADRIERVAGRAGGDVDQHEAVELAGRGAEQRGHHGLAVVVGGEVVAQVRRGHDGDLGLVGQRLDRGQVVVDAGCRVRGGVRAAGQGELVHLSLAGRAPEPRRRRPRPARARAGSAASRPVVRLSAARGSW